ncbi:MAG: MATE family efflux transporter [Pirellulaceae bacterium]|nr:MATE family efflux transporter [Pirellulaceae bacterium]
MSAEIVTTTETEPASGPIAAEPTSWWSRPCGGREVLAIALPLVVQTAFWSIMWFIDRMFLTWYSKPAMAAALPAGMFFWVLICFPQGIASFVNTFVAQYYGAGRPERIGLAVQQGIWFGWLVTPLLLLAIPLAPWLFSGAGATDEIIRQEVLYFQTLTLGAGPLVISAAMASFYTGRGLTRVVMFVDVAGSIVNIVLDYLLIFGKFGLPELGIAGAGLATAIANWSVVLVYWILLRRSADREKFGFASQRFDWTIFSRMLRFGVPGALPLLVEGGAFALLIKHVSAIGENEAAATNLAFNVNSVAFVPLIGISIGVSTLVGQKLGEDRPELAARATWTGVVLALIYAGIFAILYLGIPEFFLLAHAAQADPHEFAPIRELTLILLRFVALYCLFDALQIVFVGALKGAGDTWFVLGNAIVVSAVALFIGTTLEVQYAWKQNGWQLWGWWWVLTGWISTLGVVYCLRFLQGAWRSMRVIEPPAAD